MQDESEKSGLKAMPPEVLRRIALFAERYGRTWKAHLNNAWLTGSDLKQPQGALLRQARNNWADKMFRRPMADEMLRLYRVTWGEGYSVEEPALLFNGEFTDDDGYTQEFRDFTGDIVVGDTKEWSDPSGSIKVERVV